LKIDLNNLLIVIQSIDSFSIQPAPFDRSTRARVYETFTLGFYGGEIFERKLRNSAKRRANPITLG